MPELIPLIVAVVVLLRICWTDFFHLKIYNRDLLVLAGAVAVFLILARPDDIVLRFGLGALLFAVGFGFWAFGKAGAGDAKLLGIVGVLIPPESAVIFAMLILAFTVGLQLLFSKAEVIRFLPVMAGRRMTELIAMRRLPYGVPIALAAIALLAPTMGI